MGLFDYNMPVYLVKREKIRKTNQTCTSRFSLPTIRDLCRYRIRKIAHLNKSSRRAPYVPIQKSFTSIVLAATQRDRSIIDNRRKYCIYGLYMGSRYTIALEKWKIDK